MADLDTVAKCPTLVRGTTQNSDFLLYPAQNCRSYPQKTTGDYKKPQILVVPGFLRISPCLVASSSSKHQPLPCSIFQQQLSKSRTRHLDICPIGR